jgi:hypothetical protein
MSNPAVPSEGSRGGIAGGRPFRPGLPDRVAPSGYGCAMTPSEVTG